MIVRTNQRTKREGIESRHKKVEQLENEELACSLKNHNQTLLTQIRNLKNDKKLLENKLEQFIKKKASKSSAVKIKVVEKGENTDAMDITTQKDSNPIREKTYKDVGVQTMEGIGVLIMELSTN